MLQIHILTLFPEMFKCPFDSSILKRARSAGFISINTVNIRKYATDAYKSVDDHPYGGGHGMIMRVDIIDKAIKEAKKNSRCLNTHTVLLDTQGTPYTQKIVWKLARYESLILICGHYEGVDERVRSLVDEEISIGDYILSGGEIPAMVIVDSVVRTLPGVFKYPDVTQKESFTENLLEYPQYTRPAIYDKKRVPHVLLSGNHKKITVWRNEQSIKRTKKYRADLYKK